MLILFAKFVNLLTAILGWGSFLTTGLLAVALFLEGKRKVTAFAYADNDQHHKIELRR